MTNKPLTEIWELKECKEEKDKEVLLQFKTDLW